MSNPFGGPSSGVGVTGGSAVAAPSGTREVVTPSVLPLIVALVAIAVSAALWFLFPMSPTVAMGGYALTPFVVGGALAWARWANLRHSANPWYDKARGERQLRILQLLMVLGFALGLFHIWRIATEVATWFA